jgi:hypothetical protein
LRLGLDGACHYFVLLYFALDEHGESDSQYDLRCDELLCGVHDVLQKSVLFACLRGKRRGFDHSVGIGFNQGYFISFRGCLFLGFSSE